MLLRKIPLDHRLESYFWCWRRYSCKVLLAKTLQRLGDLSRSIRSQSGHLDEYKRSEFGFRVDSSTSKRGSSFLTRPKLDTAPSTSGSLAVVAYKGLTDEISYGLSLIRGKEQDSRYGHAKNISALYITSGEISTCSKDFQNSWSPGLALLEGRSRTQFGPNGN